MKLAAVLRAILYFLRGTIAIFTLLWSVIAFTLAPTLIRNGFSGLRDRLATIALAGVPFDCPARLTAVDQMDRALVTLALVPVLIVGIQGLVALALERRERSTPSLS